MTQSYLRSTLYHSYLTNVRPPFLSSFSPPLPFNPTSSSLPRATSFFAHSTLNELDVLDRFVVCHAWSLAVGAESELMLDGGEDWKSEVFTLLQVRFATPFHFSTCTHEGPPSIFTRRSLKPGYLTSYSPTQRSTC